MLDTLRRMGSGPLTQSELDELKLERDFTGEDVQTIVRRTFQDNAHAAAKSITNLAIHSKNDRLRLQAATYVVERVVGRVQDDPPKPVDDPFTSLWKEITNADKEALVRNANPTTYND